jgi:hypothetical protein
VKQRARLDNWKLSRYWGGPHIILLGNVTGHPKAAINPELKDGEYIHTSNVLRIDFDKMEAETMNTIYSLGAMANG